MDFDKIYIPTALTTVEHLHNSLVILYSIILNHYFYKIDCAMSNKQLGEILGIKRRAISLNLSKLKDKGFISIEYKKTNYYNYNQRIIVPLKYLESPKSFCAID